MAGEVGNPHWQYKPGVSGNPSGRPKETEETKLAKASVKKLALMHCPEAIERLVELMRSADGKISGFACNAILDRGIGKPNQAIVGGEDGDEPLKVSGIELHIVDHRPKTEG